METSLYDSDHSNNSSYNNMSSDSLKKPDNIQDLKKSLTLDFTSPENAKKALKTPDLYTFLNLTSPEMQKFLTQGVATVATPTPTSFIFPKNVTAEQEQYARGFIDALNEIHKLNGFVPPQQSKELLSPGFVSTAVAETESPTGAKARGVSPGRQVFNVITSAISPVKPQPQSGGEDNLVPCIKLVGINQASLQSVLSGLSGASPVAGKDSATITNQQLQSFLAMHERPMLAGSMPFSSSAGHLFQQYSNTLSLMNLGGSGVSTGAAGSGSTSYAAFPSKTMPAASVTVKREPDDPLNVGAEVTISGNQRSPIPCSGSHHRNTVIAAQETQNTTSISVSLGCHPQVNNAIAASAVFLSSAASINSLNAVASSNSVQLLPSSHGQLSSGLPVPGSSCSAYSNPSSVSSGSGSGGSDAGSTVTNASSSCGSPTSSSYQQRKHQTATRRGRVPGLGDGGSSSLGFPLDPHHQEAMKLERKRARNRVAASKCRERKIKKIESLQDQVDRLILENDEHEKRRDIVRRDVQRLKQLVVEHQGKGCRFPVDVNGFL